MRVRPAYSAARNISRMGPAFREKSPELLSDRAGTLPLHGGRRAIHQILLGFTSTSLTKHGRVPCHKPAFKASLARSRASWAPRIRVNTLSPGWVMNQRQCLSLSPSSQNGDQKIAVHSGSHQPRGYRGGRRLSGERCEPALTARNFSDRAGLFRGAPLPVMKCEEEVEPVLDVSHLSCERSGTPRSHDVSWRIGRGKRGYSANGSGKTSLLSALTVI